LATFSRVHGQDQAPGIIGKKEKTPVLRAQREKTKRASSKTASRVGHVNVRWSHPATIRLVSHRGITLRRTCWFVVAAGSIAEATVFRFLSNQATPPSSLRALNGTQTHRAKQRDTSHHSQRKMDGDPFSFKV